MYNSIKIITLTILSIYLIENNVFFKVTSDNNKYINNIKKTFEKVINLTNKGNLNFKEFNQNNLPIISKSYNLKKINSLIIYLISLINYYLEDNIKLDVVDIKINLYQQTKNEIKIKLNIEFNLRKNNLVINIDNNLLINSDIIVYKNDNIHINNLNIIKLLKEYLDEFDNSDNDKSEDINLLFNL